MSTKRHVRRGLRRRNRDQTRELTELLDFVIDHEDYVIERYEAKKEEIKKAEEAAKKKMEEEKNQSFFVKKFTFGQMFFWVWITQPVFGFLWYIVLKGLI